jgi:hypothetical protein
MDQKSAPHHHHLKSQLTPRVWHTGRLHYLREPQRDRPVPSHFTFINPTTLSWELLRNDRLVDLEAESRELMRANRDFVAAISSPISQTFSNGCSDGLSGGTNRCRKHLKARWLADRRPRLVEWLDAVITTKISGELEKMTEEL